MDDCKCCKDWIAISKDYEQQLTKAEQDRQYLQDRCAEFEKQVSALIEVRDRQKVEIAELRKEKEALENVIKHQRNELISRAKVEAELKKPVTDEEWEAWVSQSAFVHNRRKATDALIQSRLPKERQ